MGQQVTEVMCRAAPRSLGPLQHKLWRSKQKGNSFWLMSASDTFFSITLLHFFVLFILSASLPLFINYIQVHTHMRTHTHAHTHTYTHTHTHMCTHVWHTLRHTYTQRHAHTYTHTTICVLECIPWSKLCSTCSVRDPSNSSSAWNRKLRYESHITS